jgi:hypothetical protein
MLLLEHLVNKWGEGLVIGEVESLVFGEDGAWVWVLLGIELLVDYGAASPLSGCYSGSASVVVLNSDEPRLPHCILIWGLYLIVIVPVIVEPGPVWMYSH